MITVVFFTTTTTTTTLVFMFQTAQNNFISTFFRATTTTIQAQTIVFFELVRVNLMLFFQFIAGFIIMESSLSRR